MMNEADLKSKHLLWLFVLIAVFVYFVWGFISGKFSFLWLTGSLSVAGTIVLLLSEKALGFVYSAVTVLALLALMVITALMPDVSSDGTWSPKMLLYAAGTGLPACVTLVWGLFSRCDDLDVLFGGFTVKLFINEAMRYVFALIDMTMLMIVFSTIKAGTTLRCAIGIPCACVTLLVLVVLLIRYYLAYLKYKQAVDAQEPTESDEELYERVTEFMEQEKPFLDKNFSADDICKALGTNRSYLSRCMALCAGLSVPRLVNKYRVRYAMKLYSENMNLKVSDLWSMSGFGSGVTFATAFRLECDMNPRDWCRNQRDLAAIEHQRLSRLKELEHTRSEAPLSQDEAV